jgi:hypothetical protein
MMEPVSNIDRLMIVLRQKLEQRQRASSGRTSTSQASASQTSASRFAAIAAADGVDERQVRRTFIQALLADRLGETLVNDAQFQQVVSRVTDAMEQDEPTAALLSRVIADIRRR